MKLLEKRHVGKLVAGAAMAAVVGFASPAAALVSSTTSATANPAAATVGQAVRLTATVTCAEDPTGGLGVTFFDGATLLATVPVEANGTAELATNFSTTGAHEITAAYNGNDNCGASNDETTVTVSEVTPPPPPPTTSAPCFLICGGNFLGFNVGNINNTIIIH